MASDGDEYLILEPNEAALLFAFTRLVILMDREGIISREAFAEDIASCEPPIADQGKTLLRYLTKMLRRGSTPKLGVLEGGKPDGDEGPDAA